MVVCVNCHLEMQCTKTGKGVRFHRDHVYPGDEFTCMGCGAAIIKCNDQPTYDPNQDIETIQMPS